MKSKVVEAPRTRARRTRTDGKMKRAPSKRPRPRSLSIEWLQQRLAAGFPSPKLTIELVPKTSWFSNVRDHVTQAEWDRLRQAAYQQAGDACQICGGRGAQRPVECHEIWHYDDLRGVQTLVDLTALCPSCHGVKHFGLTAIRGQTDQALEQLANVNGWSKADARKYLDFCIKIWKARSNRTWQLDLSWLSKKGITVSRPAAAATGRITPSRRGG